MRYRALDVNGDTTFGQPGAVLIDSPAAVVQAIETRLALHAGTWFLDMREGTPYAGKILGYQNRAERDQAIRERILGTPGVRELTEFSTNLTEDRRYVVRATVDTNYGSAALAVTL